MQELKEHEEYYNEMLLKDRLIGYRYDNTLHAILTFHVGDIDDSGKFVRDNPFSLVDDNPGGNICFIDHLITSKDKSTHDHIFDGWGFFKGYIKHNFPNVTHIRWNRYKGGEFNAYSKSIK